MFRPTYCYLSQDSNWFSLNKFAINRYNRSTYMITVNTRKAVTRKVSGFFSGKLFTYVKNLILQNSEKKLMWNFIRCGEEVIFEANGNFTNSLFQRWVNRTLFIQDIVSCICIFFCFLNNHLKTNSL